MLKTKIIKQFLNLKTGLFSLESLPLTFINQLITGQKNSSTHQENKQALFNHINKLLQDDAQNIEKYYPLSVLLPEESPFSHLKNINSIYFDAISSSLRRKNNITQLFSSKIENSLDQYPKYYRRNFHHQTDGYLSLNSAKKYELQVELLFKGLANSMRRQLIPPLYRQISHMKQPKILEIACGTGVFTRQLAKTFPHAQITALDLSPTYIEYAKTKSLNFKNIHFIVGDACDLIFKDSSFDATTSIFLFHEMPLKERKQALNEALRVTKENGFWGIMDSIQYDDIPEMNWALEQFPHTFHEPFYKNYCQNNIEQFLSKSFPQQNFATSYHFLSKIVYRKLPK